MLERAWLAYLDRLRPSAALLKVFEASLLKTWRDATCEAETRRTLAQQRVARLRQQGERLLQVYVYEQAIDQEVFERERVRTSEALTLAELDLRDARVEELDVRASSPSRATCASTRGNSGRKPTTRIASPLQACLFPDGVHYQGGVISNSTKSPLFNDFAPLQAYDAHVASPTRFELVLPA